MPSAVNRLTETASVIFSVPEETTFSAVPAVAWVSSDLSFVHPGEFARVAVHTP